MRGRYTSAMRQLTSACVLLLGTLVLGACGDTLPTGSGATGLRDALNFTTTSLPVQSTHPLGPAQSSAHPPYM